MNACPSSVNDTCCSCTWIVPGPAFVTMMAGLAILLLFPAVRYGWDGNLKLLADWWHTVTGTTAPTLMNPDNVSLRAMFTKWLGPDSAAPVLTAITIGIYIFAYTPLKRTSTANTAVGAIPGAIPPMIGWAAARGDIGAGAWSLFAIVFLWQMPHFFAIAWMFREDYSRAGFRMISSDDSSGERSASQSVFFCILLLVLACLPAFVGIVSYIYQPIQLLLGGLFVAVAMRFLRLRTPSAARLLFFASIAYLPLLLAALVLTKL